jgi:hypothetical protein
MYIGHISYDLTFREKKMHINHISYDLKFREDKMHIYHKSYYNIHETNMCYTYSILYMKAGMIIDGCIRPIPMFI